MYSDYLQYVKDYLIEHNGYYPKDERFKFRCKYEHTLRVLHWCKLLVDDIPGIDEHALFIAAIFHDVGYCADADNSNHAERSAQIFKEYALQNGIDETEAEKIYYLINKHSNKELLSDSNVMPELVILMEADLLDEEGALRVIWYVATKAILGADSYQNMYDYIQMGSDKRKGNPMVTPLAKELWEKKNRLVDEFQAELSEDLYTDILNM